MYLIIFDLDDTLLHDDRTVSDFTVETLKKAQEQGNLIAINTSRSSQNSQKVVDRIHPDFGIYSGGAQIVDKDGKTIYECYIDSQKTLQITSILYKTAINVSIQTREHYYTSSTTYKAQNAEYIDFSNGVSYESYKIMVKSFDFDYLAELAETYDLAYQNYLGGPFSRFGNKDATKHKGNLALKKIVGEDYKTIVFGDDSGDEEMIMNADVGVVMANGREELIQKAPHLTLSNNEDGVARFLVKYLNL